MGSSAEGVKGSDRGISAGEVMGGPSQVSLTMGRPAKSSGSKSELVAMLGRLVLGKFVKLYCSQLNSDGNEEEPAEVSGV